MVSSPLVVLDIETDGLDPTKIWVAVTKSLPGGETEVHYTPASLAEALGGSRRVVGHNLIGYDLPVLERLWGLSVASERVIDTLVMSRLADPQRPGGHSLKEWGEKLGFPKGAYSDWSQCSEEMVQYCQQDVAVTERVYYALLTELGDVLNSEAYTLEHEVQFIIQQQVCNGWLIDQSKAYQLLAKLKERQYAIEEKVQTTFLPLPVYIKEVTPKYKKDGNFSTVGLKFLGDSWETVGGPFSRVDFPSFNLGSRQQIGRFLQHFGWKPECFTGTGQAVVDEPTLAKVKDIPEAQLIAEYLLVQTRVAHVQSWLDAMDERDGRVHGAVKSNGTVTGRMTHSGPNMAQVPSGHSPYGKECRECWTVPDGYSLVGFDASGLELRMLAHYMRDEGFIHEILTGDIHKANQKLAGLESRDQAKTFIYALIYGAGNAKLGSVVGGDKGHGERLRRRFFHNLPAFPDLRDRVSSKAQRGFLIGLDGRHVPVRSEHSALNTLLQSAGAIVMKKALTTLDEYAKLWGITYNFIGNIHDEVQTEVKTSESEKFGRLATSCIEAAGIHFNLRCPLAGEFKIGRNWSETH